MFVHNFNAEQCKILMREVDRLRRYQNRRKECINSIVKHEDAIDKFCATPCDNHLIVDILRDAQIGMQSNRLIHMEKCREFEERIVWLKTGM